MAFLTLVMEPTVAIAALVLPIVATNVQQYFTTPHRMETARNYSWIAASLIVSIFITAMLITQLPESFLVIAIGAVMCLFSLHTLSGFRLPMGSSPPWQIGVGISAGICGGLSAIWAPPIVMYLLARNVSKDQFVSACGFLFMVGSIPLGAGLMVSGVLNSETLALSLVGLLTAMAGFKLGARFRQRLANDTFRKAVLIAFFILGARLVVSGVMR
jgi:uncharacterized protein